MKSLPLTIAIIIAAAGCTSSSDPVAEGGFIGETLTTRAVAERLIEETLASELSLGELTAVCPEVDPVLPGTLFKCTASAEGSDREVRIDGEINPEGYVEVATTNVIKKEFLAVYEAAMADALNEQVGSTVMTPDKINCGDETLVLNSDLAMLCVLVDPNSQLEYNVAVYVEDIDLPTFQLVVAAEPRQ